MCLSCEMSTLLFQPEVDTYVMFQVYKARLRSSGELVAVKVFLILLILVLISSHRQITI